MCFVQFHDDLSDTERLLLHPVRRWTQVKAGNLGHICRLLGAEEAVQYQTYPHETERNTHK